MQGRAQVFQIWRSVENIANGANRVMNLGSDVGAGTIALSNFMPYLTFSIIADQILRMDVETSVDGVNWRVPHTLTTIAATIMTAYDMPAPTNQTGWLVIAAPQMRIRVTNASGFDTSYFEFFGSLTNFGG